VTSAPDCGVTMKSINILKTISLFCRERHIWLESKHSHGWTPNKDSLWRLSSEFSPRTRNLQACLGENGQKINVASFHKLLILMKSILLCALEHPLDPGLSHWLQLSFSELWSRYFGRAAPKSS